MNNYHRYLKIPFELNAKIPNFQGKKAVDLTVNDMNPELVNWFYDTFKLKIKRFQCFHIVPLHAVNQQIGIHADTNVEDSCKINWSFNAPNSVMRWFEMKPGIQRPSEIPSGVLVTNMVVPEYNDVELKYTAKIGTGGSLVNVYHAHDIINYENASRYTFTAVFLDPAHDYKKNLLWPRALELFKDYIIDSEASERIV
jgi:hypothetical protein